MATNRASLLITAVDLTRDAFKSASRNLTDLSDSAKKITASLAALAALGGLTLVAKQSLDAADNLFKMAQRVGITVEALSTLVPAAELSGASSEELEKGLRKLAGTLVDAASGAQEAQRDLAALGVSATDNAGQLRPVDAVLLDLADRFASLPDGALKTDLAIRAFGKSGASLIPFLNQGRAGIEALREEMRALGVLIDGQTAARAEAFNDALDKLAKASRGVVNDVVAALLPGLLDLANGFVESAKQGGGLRRALDVLIPLFKGLLVVVVGVGQAFVGLGEIIGAGWAAQVQLLAGNVRAAKSILLDLKNNLAARFAEVQRFAGVVFNPPQQTDTPAPTPKRDGDVLQKLGKRDTDAAAREKAEAAFAKARADAELAILKDGLERQARLLEEALEDRLLAYRAYADQKTVLDQQAIDAEIARTQALIAEQQRLQTSTATGVTASDRLRAQAELAKLEGELTVLNAKRADAAVINARKAAQAERALRDELAKVRDELFAINGTATDSDRRSAIERQFRDLRQRLLAEGDVDGVSLVDRLIDVKTAQANLDALEATWRQTLQRIRDAQEAIRIRQDSGDITTLEAERQLLEAQRAGSRDLAEMLPAMEAAANAIGPEAVARVQAWRNELARTKLEVSSLWATIKDGLTDALARFFEAIATGAKTAKEAFLDFGRAVIQMIIQLIAKKIALMIVEQAADSASGGYGALVKAVVEALGGGETKKADGGYVTGPGTSTSDSIRARLSHGEYVVRASAVKRVGVAFLDAINGITVGPRVAMGRLAFADGGFVPRMEQSNGGGGSSVRIVNAIDPALVHDELQTPAGERVIVNVIGRNARAIRAALG